MATNVGKVGMVLKGDWSSSSTYEVLDAVHYNGGLYIAKTTVPAGTPPTNSTYWQIGAAAATPIRETISMATLDTNLSGNMYIDVQNNVVSVSFYDLKGSSFSTIAGAIPSAYRPSHVYRGILIKNDGTGTALISIATNGNLVFANFDTNTFYTGTLTYVR